LGAGGFSEILGKPGAKYERLDGVGGNEVHEHEWQQHENDGENRDHRSR
jgi:hypothetical protein